MHKTLKIALAAALLAGSVGAAGAAVGIGFNLGDTKRQPRPALQKRLFLLLKIRRLARPQQLVGQHAGFAGPGPLQVLREKLRAKHRQGFWPVNRLMQDQIGHQRAARLRGQAVQGLALLQRVGGLDEVGPAG